MTLRPSRIKILGGFLGCMLFAIGGVLMGLFGAAQGYAGAAFFGLGLPIFGFQLLPRATYLQLTGEGFTCCVLFRAHSYRWADVQEFGTFQTGPLHAVGWNFTPEYLATSPKRELSLASKCLCGYEAHLQNDYGMKPAALAELLNGVLRERAAIRTHGSNAAV